MDIKSKVFEELNTKAVKAQVALVSVARELEKAGMSRNVLNELRDCLEEIEYDTRKMYGKIFSVEG